ncbi:MAG: phage minor capsid protein [Clostridia bacterium]
MPKINSEYDIGAAFQAIENELIASMIRNMRRHKIEEIDEDKQWSMWQAEQLRSLEKYRKENQERFGAKFKDINNRIEALISTARDEGDMEQEIAILEAIKKGFQARRVSPGASAAFFRLNQRKLEALIRATTSDMEKAETAVLRMANDQYRKIIFNAQIYANSGAGTYEKAVDMATKDFIAAGLNCVEYANGSRHTLADYADMAIRTASKRAYLQGEGQKRQEWGISTVIMNKRGNPCPKCLPFVGKILIDDVWSGGSAKDGPYPLMSAAIAAGLYHPRCRDSHTTYFPELEDLDNEYSKKDIEDIEEQNRKEARQQYAERQEKKFHRLASFSLDPENKSKYRAKEKEWSQETEDRYKVPDEVKVPRSDTPQIMIDLMDQYTRDECIKIDELSEYAFSYDLDNDLIIINPRHPQYEEENYKHVLAHEIAHRIDHNEYGSPMYVEFAEAIKNTENKILQKKEKYQRRLAVNGDLEYNYFISDIMSCITDNVITGVYRHESQYIGKPGYAESEIFADIYAALYQSDDITVEFIKSELPELYEAFMKVLKR